MTEDDPPQARQMDRGNWYWIDKALIHQYGPKVGVFGVAVYNCLASFANAQQTCYPSQDRIAKLLACSRATVNRAIGTLEANGLIAVERRGRCPQLYRLLSLRCSSGDALLSTAATLDVAQVRTNNNKRTRYINNSGGSEADVHNVIRRPGMALRSAVQKKIFALELAEALDDRQNLHVYQSLTRRYPESLLRRVIREVLDTPLAKIRKSRAALFKYLVLIYAEQETNNPGD